MLRVPGFLSEAYCAELGCFLLNKTVLHISFRVIVRGGSKKWPLKKKKKTQIKGKTPGLNDSDWYRSKRVGGTAALGEEFQIIL